MHRIASGASLRCCQRIALILGCRWEWVRRTGEIRVAHPSIPESVKINGRRKDAPRKLTAFLNRLITAANDNTEE